MESPIWSYIFGKKEKSYEDPIEILRNIPVFKGLSKSELRWIEKSIHTRHYSRGETVFSQDTPGAGLYIIVKGAVEVFKMEPEKVVLATLVKGQFFGELSLLDNSPRTATVVTTEPSILLGFFHPDLMALIDRKPSIGCGILLNLSKLIGKRLVETNKRLNNTHEQL